MLGVTFFGLLLTPVFYVLMRRLTSRDKATINSEAGSEPHAALAAPEGHHA
jgi:ABC-type transport system involved in cytochrome bd biosynthesis fused ATPase/permease subunit